MKQTRKVLVVDDDPGICWVVQQRLQPQGFSVESVHSVQDGRRAIRHGFEGIVILDVRLPDGDGYELFEELQKQKTEASVIFLTGYGTTDEALTSIRGGAFDFLKKDELGARLVDAVKNAFDALGEVESLHTDTVPEIRPFEDIVTQARSMKEVFRSLRKVTRSNVPVLIRGESGTGKELVARGLHDRSGRTGPFVALNCAGIPENLLEAELFGYERGAFTGADARKIGTFERAHKGTLLLDEIGEMAPALQAKLLRVIQDGEFRRLGGTEVHRADVRLLSATHRDLEEEIRTGGFREDLYYRLAVFTVTLPPLRERDGDIPLLVEHLVGKLSKKEGRDLAGVDPRALELLQSHPYPGNVRELENVIAYGVVSAPGPLITIGDLPRGFLEQVTMHRVSTPLENTSNSIPTILRESDSNTLSADAAPRATGVDQPIRTRMQEAAPADGFLSLAEMERKHIEAALERTEGNKSMAARILGINRVTLYRKLGLYGLD